MGGISITKLLIVAVIVILLFGTKKLTSLGSDLGAAIKGFKKAIGNDESAPAAPASAEKSSNDADFTAKSLLEQPQSVKAEEAKSQHKEQV